MRLGEKLEGKTIKWDQELGIREREQPVTGNQQLITDVN